MTNRISDSDANVQAPKVWRVTLTREATVFVVAEDVARASAIAEKHAIDFEAVEEPTVSEVVTAPPGYEKDDVPYGLEPDDDRSIEQILAGAPKPADAMALWEARKPNPMSLPSLVAWLGEVPSYGVHSSGFCGGSEDGRGVAACDGHAFLYVSGISAPPGKTRSGLPFEPDRIFNDATQGVRQSVIVDALVVEPWLDGAVVIENRFDVGAAISVVRVLGAELDAALLRRWVLPAAQLTEGRIEVSGALDGQGPVVWRAPGWSAIVMPRRHDEAVGPSLENFEVVQ